MKEKYYLAYGSNLSIAQMVQRLKISSRRNGTAGQTCRLF